MILLYFVEILIYLFSPKESMAKKKGKDNAKKPKDKLSLYKKIRIRLREIPALVHAKKEEQVHVPTFSELKKETQEFEKEGFSLKSLILRKGKKTKKK